MGMTLYDIDAQIAALDGAAEDDMLIDEETGEVLTQKEINRRKLAEARKADALKYGEEYKDDDDD